MMFQWKKSVEKLLRFISLQCFKYYAYFVCVCVCVCARARACMYLIRDITILVSVQDCVSNESAQFVGLRNVYYINSRKNITKTLRSSSYRIIFSCILT